MKRYCFIGAILVLLLVSLTKVTGLECYVCEHQEDNAEKCVKTIKTCEYNQDVCLTEIKWGSTPYWSQGAQKQYYVSKRCSNKTECAITRQRNMPLCTHIWYQDWVCSDCCQGDRCNYYIISGTRPLRPILSVILGVAITFGDVKKSMLETLENESGLRQIYRVIGRCVESFKAKFTSITNATVPTWIRKYV